MGQYYVIANLDKKEVICPGGFGDGAKLLEFGASSGGVMTALAALLADGNGRGGGDLRSDSKLIGSWAGDRVVIAGDYGDPGKFLTVRQKRQVVASQTQDRPAIRGSETNVYFFADQLFTDISAKVAKVLAEDTYLKQSLMQRGVINAKGRVAKNWDEQWANRDAYDKAHPRREVA